MSWAVRPEKPSGMRLLVRSKSSEPATPVTEAVTVYEPAVALAVAVTEATPLDPVVTSWAESCAEAPELGTAKVDNATGHRLDGVVGRHGDGQGIGKCGLIHRGLWRAPGHQRDGESLALESADVGIGRIKRFAALVGRDSAHGRACADGGATGQESHGLGLPSVAPQSGEYGIGDANDVAILSVDQSC